MFNQYQIRVGHQTNNCSKQCKLQLKYDLKNQVGVVYSLKCQECHGAYKGQTSQ